MNQDLSSDVQSSNQDIILDTQTSSVVNHNKDFISRLIEYINFPGIIDSIKLSYVSNGVRGLLKNRYFLFFFFAAIGIFLAFFGKEYGFIFYLPLLLSIPFAPTVIAFSKGHHYKIMILGMNMASLPLVFVPVVGWLFVVPLWLASFFLAALPSGKNIKETIKSFISPDQDVSSMESGISIVAQLKENNLITENQYESLRKQLLFGEDGSVIHHDFGQLSDKIVKLDGLKKKGLISESEFDAKRDILLNMFFNLETS